MREIENEKLLDLIMDNAKLTNTQLAVMLDSTEEAVAERIHELEKKGIIRGYRALIDWDRTGRELLSARIEIKVIPKGTMGFEEIAYTISQFPEVETCYLMSGGYDLALTIAGKSFKEIAMFVAHRLAPMEPIQSTATHFVLKKYKERGIMMLECMEDEREVSAQ